MTKFALARGGDQNARAWRDRWVAVGSRAGDVVWTFRIETPGRYLAQNVFRWDWSPPDKTLLSASRYGALVEASKHFALTLLQDPPAGRRRISASSLISLAHRMRVLVDWMAVQGIRKFKELDSRGVEAFREWLATREGRRGRATLGSGTVVHYLRTLDALYQQRTKLTDAPNEDLFPTETPAEAAGHQSTAVRAFSFLPDQLAIHLLSHALRWVETHAQGIIAAITIVREESERVGTGCRPAVARERARRRLSAASLPAPSGLSAIDLKSARRLAVHLRTACFIIIGGFVGMRVSEILSLKVGAVQVVGQRASRDRQTYLAGRVYKASDESRGRPARWVAPAPVVEAVAVLELLTASLRLSGRRQELFLLEPRSRREAGLVAGKHMSGCMNSFAGMIEMPLHEGRRWLLSTHQLRKTFARFVGRRDRTQLLALSDHFKHVSVAMTAKGYVGRDYRLDELITKETHVETTAALEQMLSSERLAGRLGERITSQGAQFRGRAGERVRKDYIAFVMKETDLRVHACDYGWCVFQAETARCGGVMAPNEAERSPAACLSCANMVVDARHLPYWRERKKRNADLLSISSPLARASLREAIEQCNRVLKVVDAGQEEAKKEDGRSGRGDGASVSGRVGTARLRRGDPSDARGQGRTGDAGGGRARSTKKP